MYAIFKSGGKQYRVSKGEIIKLEKLNFMPGEIITFNQVMMIVDEKKINIGIPFVIGGIIFAKIISHKRNNKIIITKFRRRKHYHKIQGHRQWITNIKITNINIQ